MSLYKGDILFKEAEMSKKIIGNIIYGIVVSMLILGGLYNIISTPLDWLYCLKHGYRMECTVLNKEVECSQEQEIAEIITDEIHIHEWHEVVEYEWISHGNGKGHVEEVKKYKCSCGKEK